MLTTLQLAWRLQRWELAILGVAVIAVAAALLVIAWQLGAIQAANPECWARDTDTPLDQSLVGTCDGPMRASEDWRILGEIASLFATIAPFALGLVLGVPLVAREIESRTSGIAWSLSRSRVRWLALRALPVIGFVLVAVTLISLAGSMMLAERQDGGIGFGAIIAPLPIAVMRGLAVLAIGLAIGALLGRTLPALLVTMGLSGALFVGLFLAMDVWMATEARPMEVGPSERGGSRVFELGFRDDETGELMTLTEYYSGPAGQDIETSEPEGMTMIAWKIPVEEHPVWVVRESAALAGVALLMGGVLVGVVHRRRP